MGRLTARQSTWHSVSIWHSISTMGIERGLFFETRHRAHGPDVSTASLRMHHGCAASVLTLRHGSRTRTSPRATTSKAKAILRALLTQPVDHQDESRTAGREIMWVLAEREVEGGKDKEVVVAPPRSRWATMKPPGAGGMLRYHSRARCELAPSPPPWNCWAPMQECS